MKIIKIEPYENGAYPPIQTWHKNIPPIGFAVVPDTLDTTVFYEHNGFVNLTVEDGLVTSMTANAVAWEEWKATMPTVETESEATTEEVLNALLGVTV